MDWATFFKDNAQSIFTLGGVFLGSLITFLISYLNNRFQAKERDKDRLEQRREAGIQNRQKWIERDILKIMDSVESLLSLFSELQNLGLRNYSILKQKDGSLFTQDELKLKVKEGHERFQEAIYESNQAFDLIGRLVFSFEEEDIHSSYSKFLDAVTDFMSTKFGLNENPDEEAINNAWSNVKMDSGEFQRALRNKLISLRE